MVETLADLLATPRLYPRQLDPATESVTFIPMTEDDYRRASFLDERIQSLSPRAPLRLETYAGVAQAAATLSGARPLHFIFPGGLVGWPLLAPLLGECGGVLSLREPLPLRLFAQMQDAGVLTD